VAICGPDLLRGAALQLEGDRSGIRAAAVAAALELLLTVLRPVTEAEQPDASAALTPPDG
jgi:hypothetical protein